MLSGSVTGMLVACGLTCSVLSEGKGETSSGELISLSLSAVRGTIRGSGHELAAAATSVPADMLSVNISSR